MQTFIQLQPAEAISTSLPHILDTVEPFASQTWYLNQRAANSVTQNNVTCISGFSLISKQAWLRLEQSEKDES